MTDIPGRLVAALDGRYRVERLLGDGGMATVYVAHDLKHQRRVAIKVLRPELSAALGTERFLNEIRVTAALQHPHILGLIDSGDADGLLYYIMPYVEGATLRSRLATDRQLPLPEALRLTQEIAAALDYAHRQGVIHRDIKPENILLSEGRALVADFGIARAVDVAGGEHLTQTGLAIGTPAYMSPEQAAGDRELDGRSDTYSLACVTYEMLAGEPPFTGPSAQAILAKRLSESAPRLTTLREVPPAVEQAVTRALARAPSDRFATSAEFGAALSAESRDPALRGVRRPRRRALLVTGVVLVLGLVAAGLIRASRGREPALAANLVAIAPFEVLDPTLELWREGMGDVLSRYLDGAGPLTTVPPSQALKHWSGRADRSSAEALGRRTGAGVVVFGSAIPKGRDSVLLRASVLRVSEGDVDEVEVSGAEERMGDLADSLGRGILEVLGRSRPIGAVRRSSLGAGSLPALKAFLRGEQFYRLGEMDSALVHYARSTSLDSGFALPYRRMATIVAGTPATAAAYATMEDYVFRAEQLNHGLSPQDSFLIAGMAQWTRGQIKYERLDPEFARDVRAAIRTFEEAARRNPTDPETWYLLADVRFHNGRYLGIPLEDQLAPFERAIELDSSFAQAYEHVVHLAIELGDGDKARALAAAYGTNFPDAVDAPEFRLVRMALDRSPAQEVDHFMDSVGHWAVLWEAWDELMYWPDSAETSVRIARQFPRRPDAFATAPSRFREPMVHNRAVTAALAARGRLREAREVSAERHLGGWLNRLVDLALLGIGSDDANVAFLELLEADSLLPPQLVHSEGLPWWLLRGDSAALTRFAQRADSIATRHQEPVGRQHLAYLGDAARAYTALLRGDSAGALGMLEALPDSMCLLETCFFQQLTRARLLGAAGRDRDAANVLDRWELSRPGVWFVIARMERGRVAERLNDRDRAVAGYAFVAAMWRNADPELDAYVSEARAGLARLTREGPAP